MTEMDEEKAERTNSCSIDQCRQMEEALRESELFRSIVENSHSGILIINDNFKIIYANSECTRISGYTKEKIVGQDFRKFLAEESKPLAEERYLSRQRGERVPSSYEFKIVRKDGEKRTVEIKSTTIRDNRGKVRTIAQLLDITERKRMEEERTRYEERLTALNKYAQSLNMAKSIQEICSLTLDAAQKTLGFKYAGFYLVDGRNLRLVAHRGYLNHSITILPLDGEKGIIAKAARTGKTAFVPDVSKDNAYIEIDKNIRSEIATPIKVGDKVLGVLNVESEQLAAFN
ncbi:MAG: PAS domain S-box protein, partial [Candidatus Bathyarchaeia archaeon]